MSPFLRTRAKVSNRYFVSQNFDGGIRFTLYSFKSIWRWFADKESNFYVTISNPFGVTSTGFSCDTDTTVTQSLKITKAAYIQ